MFTGAIYIKISHYPQVYHNDVQISIESLRDFLQSFSIFGDLISQLMSNLGCIVISWHTLPSTLSALLEVLKFLTDVSGLLIPIFIMPVGYRE